jgi:hypothetical protein
MRSIIGSSAEPMAGKNTHSSGRRASTRSSNEAETCAGARRGREWRTNHGEYRQYARSYYAMPNSFVDDGHLARLFAAGRARALPIVPIIGIHMNTVNARGYYSGYEALSRLSGVSRRSIGAAQEALLKSGVGVRGSARRANGLPVSTWKLDRLAYVGSKPGEHVTSQHDGTTGRGGYFHFPAAAVFGGNWQCLSPTQQAMYLAVGAQARTYSAESASRLLREYLDPSDFDALVYRGNRMVLAFASYADIMRLSGIRSSKAVARAIHALPPLVIMKEDTALVNQTTIFTSLETKGRGNRLFAFFYDFLPVDGAVPEVPSPEAQSEVTPSTETCTMLHQRLTAEQQKEELQVLLRNVSANHDVAQPERAAQRQSSGGRRPLRRIDAERPEDEFEGFGANDYELLAASDDLSW